MAGYVGKVNIGGSELSVGSTLYGTCDSAADAVAKVVTCADFDTLIEGVTIHVKFTNGNTNRNPTLNVNSTGAKSIGGQPTPWVFSSNVVVPFTYDGTYWRVSGCTRPSSYISATCSSVVGSTGKLLQFSGGEADFGAITRGTVMDVLFENGNTASSLAFRAVTQPYAVNVTVGGVYTSDVTSVPASGGTGYNPLHFPPYTYARFVYDGTNFDFVGAFTRPYAAGSGLSRGRNLYGGGGSYLFSFDTVDVVDGEQVLSATDSDMSLQNGYILPKPGDIIWVWNESGDDVGDDLLPINISLGGSSLTVGSDNGGAVKFPDGKFIPLVCWTHGDLVCPTFAIAPTT